MWHVTPSISEIRCSVAAGYVSAVAWTSLLADCHCHVSQLDGFHVVLTNPTMAQVGLDRELRSLFSEETGLAELLSLPPVTQPAPEAATQPADATSTTMQAILATRTVSIDCNTTFDVVLLIDPVTGSVVCPQQTLAPSNPTTSNSADCVVMYPQSEPNNASRQQPAPIILPTHNSNPHLVEPPSPVADPMVLVGPAVLPSIPACKPLSPYNFFFQDERRRILENRDELTDLSEERMEFLLHEHWGRDRSKRRPHRKSHGKIDFKSPSKLISSRWKALPEEGKDFYRRMSAKDVERYKAMEAVACGDCP